MLERSLNYLYYRLHSNCFTKGTQKDNEEYILEFEIPSLNQKTILEVQTYLLEQNKSFIESYLSKIISSLNNYLERFTEEELSEISYFHFDNSYCRLLEITNIIGYEKRINNRINPEHISYNCNLNKFYF